MRSAISKALVATFGCLVGMKLLVALAEGRAPLHEKIPIGLMYAALFGSPQLLWLKLCWKPPSNPVRVLIALFVAGSFVLMSIYFGSFPGTQPPHWAGEAHFEVPAAFIVELVVALCAYLLFALARDRSV